MPVFHEQQLVELARAAGKAIMKELDNPTFESRIQYKKDGLWVPPETKDASPVTPADKEADKIVLGGLRELTPEIPIMSEEMSPEEHQRLMKKREYWCVDPLDGTKTAMKYVGVKGVAGDKKQSGFGVLISLIRDGKPVFGVAHYPAQGLDDKGNPRGITYFTNARGKAAYRKEGDSEALPIWAQAYHGSQPIVVTGFRGEELEHLTGMKATVDKAVGGGRILHVANGTANVAYMGNEGDVSFAYWDLAAPYAILKAAKGEMVTLPGDFAQHQAAGAFARSEPLRFDGTHFVDRPELRNGPYLPACAALHPRTLERFRAGASYAQQVTNGLVRDTGPGWTL